MHKYFLKTPWWVKRLFSSYIWKMPAKGKNVYLTFDDGPHPTITPWVLDELRRHNALATFFCIGKNVAKHPEVYQQVLAEGHSVGNHTHSHYNGWKTTTEIYLNDVKKAGTIINSELFRPPYGKIKHPQAKELQNTLGKENVKVIMWDVLSADFDLSISPETCTKIVLKHVEPGSIVVFHDSEKAYRNLQYTLPNVLNSLEKSGYRFERL